jgi:hypothetical protein
LGLPESFAVQDHVCVARNDEGARGRRGGGTENVNLARRCLPLSVRNRPSLHSGVLQHLELRISTAQLIDARNDDVELDTQLRKDLPPLWRPRS